MADLGVLDRQNFINRADLVVIMFWLPKF